MSRAVIRAPRGAGGIEGRRLHGKTPDDGRGVPQAGGPVAVTDLTAAERERLVGFPVLIAAHAMRDHVSGLPAVANMEPEDVLLKLEGDMVVLQTAANVGKAPPTGFGATIKG